MPELPTGTVTFLFSDIEGSTRLLQECGDRWPAVLARHQELLRSAFTEHGGVEVGTEGDSFFVAFRSAPAALAAAVAAQRALSAEPWPKAEVVRTRIGLHTGEALASGGSYVGLDVHRAARIMGAGHGGQILLSASTEALVGQSLADGVELIDLGPHRLKDLAAPEHLFAARAEGLPGDFPPLRTLDVAPNNLPTQLTSFLGREEETRRIRELLSANRLVTLTGPGGTGKTRLSLQVAAEMVDAFSGGVYFVPLAPIRELELVLPTIGETVGLADPGRKPLERLAQHLEGRRVLLVLDNLEQVVEAAHDIGELARLAPDVSILSTSRSALRVYGEQEYPVPPLSLPDPRELPPDVGITRYPAVMLFVERARAVRPDFAVTTDNAAAVAEICWRLDGLPLAIELAAARIRILTPQAMVARLGKRLDLGSGGARDLPERQQTLRGAIAWSHDLLEADERRFFASFSVFAGGAELEAVEAVLGSDGGDDVLEAIGSLLDKSLLRQDEEPDGATRFRMLETIREYAEERLVEDGEADAVPRRHATHYLAWTESLAGRVMGAEQKVVLDAMAREHDNIRAAMAWAQEAGEAELALRFLAACWRFWHMRGHLVEAAERASRVLALPGVDQHPRLLARAEEAAGGIVYWQGDFQAARAHYERALAIQREMGDDAEIANALYNLSMSYVIEVEGEEAVLDPAAQERGSEALAIYRRLGDRGGEGRALWVALDVNVIARAFDEARELGRECLTIFTEVGDRFMLAWTNYMLGLNENLAGQPDAGRRYLAAALEIFKETEDLSGYALALDGFAVSAYRTGDVPRAMRLAGAANAIQDAGGTRLGRLNREWSDFHPDRLLSDPELAAAYEVGRQMPIDAVLELALSPAVSARPVP
ncbi:MAG: adenylate/guanylate cyclase domain-containing protein [Candidatus Limnocylindria bacterium]